MSTAPLKLDLGVSESVEQASTALCSLKLDMDRYARDYIGQPYLNDWMDSNGTCAFWGDSFLRLVIPFLGWEPRVGACFKAYVDPRHVLGASIKGLPEHVPEAEVASRIAKYAQDFGSTDNVLYIWYRPLGILSAHEGKHRVAFMRAQNQPVIAAWVNETGYPSADRIVLIPPSRIREDWLAMLDGRYIQVLRRPRVSLTMLRAYGVKEQRWEDIPGLPNEKTVEEEILKRGLRKCPATTAEKDRSIDLYPIHLVEADDDVVVDRTVLEIEPHRFLWSGYLVATVACALTSVLLHVIHVPWVEMVSNVFLGLSVGLVCGPLSMRFRGPKRLAGDNG